MHVIACVCQKDIWNVVYMKRQSDSKSTIPVKRQKKTGFKGNPKKQTDDDMEHFVSKQPYDEAFPISVDCVRKYFGYSTKGNAIHRLINDFEEGV